MPPQLARREFLLAAASTAVAIGAGGCPAVVHAAAPVTPDQFLALSKALTQVSDLDPAIATTLLEGFLVSGQGVGLATLVAGGAVPKLANAVVAAWYSGIYDTGQGRAVATFDQALLWRAMTFTKPFADCGGETGYWLLPPQA